MYASLRWLRLLSNVGYLLGVLSLKILWVALILYVTQGDIHYDCIGITMTNQLTVSLRYFGEKILTPGEKIM